MFHLTHGLWFEKLPDGWVRLTKREAPAPGEEADPKATLIFQVAMDRDAWNNVVNAMADPVIEENAEENKESGEVTE